MISFIKKTSSKILALTTFLVIALLVFAFREKIVEQFHHVVAYYYVYQGDKEYKKSHLQKAINNYIKALDLYPGHVKARYNLGNIYVAYEDYNSAVLCYEESLKYNPDFVNARLNLGIVLSEEILDFDRAIDQYIHVVSSTPFIIDIPFIYSNKERIHINKAVAYYDMGLAYRSKSLIYWDNKGAARMYLLKAVDSYKKSLKYDSACYDTHYNLALGQHLLGNYTDATYEYCKAINIEPLNYDAHYNFALLLKDRNQYSESAKELEKAGLILDAKGDSYTTRYIYDVLSEVNQKAVAEKEYNYLVERIDKEPDNYDRITYLNGKVVVTEELDKAIVENMRKCNVCEAEKVK